MDTHLGQDDLAHVVGQLGAEHVECVDVVVGCD